MKDYYIRMEEIIAEREEFIILKKCSVDQGKTYTKTVLIYLFDALRQSDRIYWIIYVVFLYLFIYTYSTLLILYYIYLFVKVYIFM